ncbi:MULTISPECIES: DUF2853 family protein [unclassified Aureispira]|uniref:DUF2853 family protein n=1 Tax=unclassified Aureispira TaxID=2649989 RepID=UPI00069791CE|nr:MULTISPECIES: DUF2853 family protein [unclassified Aureispira]WMX13565.1 DUF2853 family protein [Aureispira sp. CCB-E]
MSKFDEKVAGYKANMEKLGIKYDEDKLIACTKACGPSIYNKDGETVSGSDQSELDRVKNNYLVKKLGLSESDDLDGIVDYAIEKMGKSNSKKYRAIFYYLCSEKAGKYPA